MRSPWKPFFWNRLAGWGGRGSGGKPKSAEGDEGVKGSEV